MPIEPMSAPCLDLCRTPRTLLLPVLGARGRPSKSKRSWRKRRVLRRRFRQWRVVTDLHRACCFAGGVKPLMLNARQRCRGKRPLFRFALRGRSARIYANARSQGSSRLSLRQDIVCALTRLLILAFCALSLKRWLADDSCTCWLMCLAGDGIYRHAQRVRRLGGAGAGPASPRSVLRSGLCLSRAARPPHQSAVVGRPGLMSIRQAA